MALLIEEAPGGDTAYSWKFSNGAPAIDLAWVSLGVGVWGPCNQPSSYSPFGRPVSCHSIWRPNVILAAAGICSWSQSAVPTRTQSHCCSSYWPQSRCFSVGPVFFAFSGVVSLSLQDGQKDTGTCLESTAYFWQLLSLISLYLSAFSKVHFADLLVNRGLRMDWSQWLRWNYNTFRIRTISSSASLLRSCLTSVPTQSVVSWPWALDTRVSAGNDTEEQMGFNSCPSRFASFLMPMSRPGWFYSNRLWGQKMEPWLSFSPTSLVSGNPLW